MEAEKQPFESGMYFSSGSTWRSDVKPNEASAVARKVLGTWNSYESGFRIILLCFFVFTLSVTIALVVQILYGKPEINLDGAVVSDDKFCTDIGKGSLVRGGSAVDAVVSAAFCLAMMRPKFAGFGGGGFMLIHKHGHNGFTEALNFREKAPAADVNADSLVAARLNVTRQGLLAAVPGIVAGLEAAHMKYGVLPWEDVVGPTIRLLELSQSSPTPLAVNPAIQKTLSEILTGGANAFYNGSLAKDIVGAAKARGGILSEEDMASYAPLWEEPISLDLSGDLRVVAPDFPSAGPALLHALGVISRKGVQPGSTSDIGARELAMNALTLSLARFFRNGDPLFSGNTSTSNSAMVENGTINADAAMIPDDLGTPTRFQGLFPPVLRNLGAHASAIDSRDLYVSYVSDSGIPLPSPLVVPGAGFALNTAMLNFDLTQASPGSNDQLVKNRPGPGKRPLSLSVPTIIVPKTKLCRGRLISGSSAVGSALQVLSRKLFLGDVIKDAVEKPRWYLGDSASAVSRFLKETRDPYPAQSLAGPYPSVNLIVKVNDSISAYADFRARSADCAAPYFHDYLKDLDKEKLPRPSVVILEGVPTLITIGGTMSVRRATHAGSWYEDSSSELSQQLSGWLANAEPVHAPAKAIISPHAGYRFCGACAAHAFKQIDPSKVRRVFILGPSHHVRMNGCALSGTEKYSTPLYDLKIHQPTYEELRQTGHFEQMSLSTDEDEHSLEMQLPYIAKVMETKADDFWIVPILVGSLNAEREALYGRILAPYLNAPDTLFVISSDFCHWGKRFRFTYYDPSAGQIHQSIEKLDKEGMQRIEELSLTGFTQYLEEFGNTICGRNPIRILLSCVAQLKRADDPPKMSMKFLQYAQSSSCFKDSDSSVSYASGSLVLS